MTRAQLVHSNRGIFAKINDWAQKRELGGRDRSGSLKMVAVTSPGMALGAAIGAGVAAPIVAGVAIVAAGGYAAYKLHLDKAIVSAALKMTDKVKAIFKKPSAAIKIKAEEIDKEELFDRFSNAAYIGDLQTVKQCIEQGCDMHKNQEIALMRAVEGGNVEVVRFLLDNGADVSVRDSRILIEAEYRSDRREDKFREVNELLKAVPKKEFLNEKELDRMTKIVEAHNRGDKFDTETGVPLGQNPIESMKQLGFDETKIEAWKTRDKGAKTEVSNSIAGFASKGRESQVDLKSAMSSMGKSQSQGQKVQ